MTPTKYYNLKKWDKAMHWKELLTFNKVDWMYAQWTDEEWKIRYPERIRPLSEHPDITQARELASKHWMILIPKE